MPVKKDWEQYYYKTTSLLHMPSRALTLTQQKYAQIEKEVLAIVYGCQKFHQYVYGRTVHVETDHKPLENILAKNLHQAPMRLQKMIMSLQKYDLEVKYKPGKEMQLADTLSRSYLPETKETLIEDLEISEVSLYSSSSYVTTKV